MSTREIYVQQGTMISEVSLVAFIRARDVAFDADNLRPGKIARMFFDEIAVNHFCQKANKIVLDAKKILTLEDANSANIAVGETVYQGVSLSTATFTASVLSYNAAGQVLTVNNLSGNFDDRSILFNYNTSIGTATATFRANIADVVNANNSDIFYNGEGVYCQNNNLYFEVLGTSGENILYVNENYVTVQTINSITQIQNAFTPGDLVFQTYQGKNRSNIASYVGRIMYTAGNASVGIVVLETVAGKLNVGLAAASTNANCRLYNQTTEGSAAAHLSYIVPYNLESGHVLRSADEPNKLVTVVSHEHSSGIISQNTISSTEVYINSANTSTINGNLMFITSGTGMGQTRRVVAVSGTTVTVNLAFTVDPEYTTKYSFGNHIIDENGSISGIFNLPAEPNFKFKTGERIFSITDTNRLRDENYSMKASAKYTAGGMINKTQKIVMSPINSPMPEYEPDSPIVPASPTDRPYTTIVPQEPITQTDTVTNTSIIPKIQLADGLSQTFFTPKPTSNKINNGIFVTSIDLFFKSKPKTSEGALQLPVTVKIAEVKNGFPTKNYVAAKSVKAKDVKISDNPSTSNTKTLTKFTFDDPVYLEPDSEYAIVVSTESPDYGLYVAEIGGDVIGADPPKRISEQPYAGSLFRTQNATTWTPYQNEDLMFVVNKAKYKTAGGAATFNLEVPPRFAQNVDRVLLHTNQLTFPTTTVTYKIKGLPKNNPASLESTFNTIVPHKQFLYGELLEKSNKAGGDKNSRVIKFGNANSVIINVEFETSDDDVTPIFNYDSFSLLTVEHDIDNAGISNNVISITNRGNGYENIGGYTLVTHAGADDSTSQVALEAADYIQTFIDEGYPSTSTVQAYAIQISGGAGSAANGFAVANTNGSNTVDFIVMSQPGLGYIENPSISIAAPIATVSNVRSTAIISGETGKSGGNIRAKYITKQFVLEDGFESGDLRVFMDCIRPNGTDLQVYYKVLSGEDNDRFSDKRWVRMFKKVDKSSSGTKDVIELEFKPNLEENKLFYYDNGTKYPVGGKFKYFAIKVAMTSTDSAVIPIVRNLRIIATPEG